MGANLGDSRVLGEDLATPLGCRDVAPEPHLGAIMDLCWGAQALVRFSGGLPGTAPYERDAGAGSDPPMPAEQGRFPRLPLAACLAPATSAAAL